MCGPRLHKTGTTVCKNLCSQYLRPPKKRVTIINPTQNLAGAVTVARAFTSERLGLEAVAGTLGQVCDTGRAGTSSLVPLEEQELEDEVYFALEAQEIKHNISNVLAHLTLLRAL